MAKKPVKQEVTLYHRDCLYALPDMSNINLKGKPILGSCPYYEFQFLLNDTTKCERWKKR